MTVEHSGLGAAYLRSHPETPIAHEDDESCATCGQSMVGLTGRFSMKLIFLIFALVIVAAVLREFMA